MAAQEMETLIASLTATDTAKRRHAAQTLASLGPDAGPAAVALVRACGDADEEVRLQAGAALEELGPPPEAALKELAILLNASHSDVGYWAATLIGRLEATAAVAVHALREALRNNPHAAVRQRIVWALGQIGPGASPALPELQATAASSEDPRLARLAQQAVGLISG